MAQDLFTYDATIDCAVDDSIIGGGHGLGYKKKYLARLAARIGGWRKEAELFEKFPAHLVLYYSLMDFRGEIPQFFPVHDVCLLAANALLFMWRQQNKGEFAISLLDWHLLPCAVLLANAGASIFLPEDSSEDAQILISRLSARLPQAGWTQAKPTPAGRFALGSDFKRHCSENPDFIDQAKDSRGCILCGSWNFLGLQIHAHARSLLLAAGLPLAVLQLSQPSRQRDATYPAIMALAPRSNSMRLAQLPGVSRKPGDLDQRRGIDLLFAPTSQDNLQCRDFCHEEIARDRLSCMLPSKCLAQKKAAATPGAMTLRPYVDVLRCQLPRQKADGQKPGPHGADFVCREITLYDLDPLTGFVPENAGSLARLRLNPAANQGKYLLRQYDILFAFRGTLASLGSVGFVPEIKIPAITGQSLCIIRALHGIDPVWLYYYLQKPQMRKILRNMAAGARILNINLETIRALNLDLPSPEEVIAINRQYSELREVTSAIAALNTKAADLVRSITGQETIGADKKAPEIGE